MYVIAVEPNKKAHTRIIDDDLNALQKAVGGNIETIYLNDDPIVIVCNSERKLNGKKMNHALTNDNGEIYDILSGTFLVAGVNSNGELTSIPGELVEKYLDRYEILHVFAKGDDGRYTVAELPAKVGDDINESLEIYEEDRAAYIEEMGEEPSEYQHVIWSNSLNVDPELWRGSFNDYIALNNLELDPDNKSELFRYIDKVNMGYWANVKNELGVDVQNEIIEIREDKDDIYSHEKHITYHEIKANKISDCLNADDRAPTYETWYLDDKGDFCCNQLLNCHSCYRIYKPNTTEAQKADLRAKMQDGTATRSDIINATQPLGDEIAKIYGWTSSNDKQQEEENNGNTITVNRKLLEMVVVELETGTGKCCNYREAKDPDITFPDISNPDVYEMQISEMDAATPLTTYHIDSRGDLLADRSWSDGRAENYWYYRLYKPETTEAQKEALREKLRNGTATRADITSVTQRLGDVISKAEEYKEYDWYKLPEREDIPNVKDKDKGKITTVSAFCEKYSEQESSASRERE